jgi:hypothetical protein
MTTLRDQLDQIARLDKDAIQSSPMSIPIEHLCDSNAVTAFKNALVSFYHSGALQRLAELAEWIPVGERLPEDGQEVLAFFPKMREPIAVGHLLRRGDGIMYSYRGTSGHESNFPSLIFTHWMPLPAAPSVKEGK